MVSTNKTTYVVYAGAPLESDTDYTVVVKTPEGAQATTTFSTALMSTSDWKNSAWILASDSTTATQMRTEFSLPAGKVTRARAFFAMPGYGTLSINGQGVDGVAGTRTWSQYDKRTIYGVSVESPVCMFVEILWPGYARVATVL